MAAHVAAVLDALRPPEPKPSAVAACLLLRPAGDTDQLLRAGLLSPTPVAFLFAVFKGTSLLCGSDACDADESLAAAALELRLAALQLTVAFIREKPAGLRGLAERCVSAGAACARDGPFTRASPVPCSLRSAGDCLEECVKAVAAVPPFHLPPFAENAASAFEDKPLPQLASLVATCASAVLLAGAPVVLSSGAAQSAKEWSASLVEKLLLPPWPPPDVAKLAAVLRDAPLTSEQADSLVRKARARPRLSSLLPSSLVFPLLPPSLTGDSSQVCRAMRHASPADLPLLGEAVLRCGSRGDARAALAALAAFFERADALQRAAADAEVSPTAALAASALDGAPPPDDQSLLRFADERFDAAAGACCSVLCRFASVAPPPSSAAWLGTGGGGGGGGGRARAGIAPPGAPLSPFATAALLALASAPRTERASVDAVVSSVRAAAALRDKCSASEWVRSVVGPTGSLPPPFASRAGTDAALRSCSIAAGRPGWGGLIGGCIRVAIALLHDPSLSTQSLGSAMLLSLRAACPAGRGAASAAVAAAGVGCLWAGPAGDHRLGPAKALVGHIRALRAPTSHAATGAAAAAAAAAAAHSPAEAGATNAVYAAFEARVCVPRRARSPACACFFVPLTRRFAVCSVFVLLRRLRRPPRPPPVAGHTNSGGATRRRRRRRRRRRGRGGAARQVPPRHPQGPVLPRPPRPRGSHPRRRAGVDDLLSLRGGGGRSGGGRAARRGWHWQRCSWAQRRRRQHRAFARLAGDAPLRAAVVRTAVAGLRVLIARRSVRSSLRRRRFVSGRCATRGGARQEASDPRRGARGRGRRGGWSGGGGCGGCGGRCGCGCGGGARVLGRNLPRLRRRRAAAAPAAIRVGGGAEARARQPRSIFIRSRSRTRSRLPLLPARRHRRRRQRHGAAPAPRRC